MSLPADKGLFQKLRKPLPDSAFDIQPQKKQEKTHKDFLFPIAAVTVVAAVIFAPEFVKQNNSDISVQKTTQKFHKLSLPQEEAQQPFQKKK